jgi:amidase
VVAPEDATVVGRLRAAGAILVTKTNCPPYGGGIETDNAVYGRTSPLRPGPYARRQQRRRRGGVRRGGLLAVRDRDRLGRERAPARPLLRAGGDQADGAAGAAHRDPRRPVPDRRPERPAHAAGPARPLGRRRRAAAAPGRRPGRQRRRRRAGGIRRPEAVDVGALRAAVHTEDGLARPTPETTATVLEAAAALRAAGATVEEARPPGRARAHDRGVGLLRRAERRGPVRPAAALGRLPRGGARARRALRRHPLPGVAGARPPARPAR